MRLVNTLSLIGYGLTCWLVVGLATTPPLIEYTPEFNLKTTRHSHTDKLNCSVDKGMANRM